VSKQFLHDAQVGTALQQVRGETMTQRMRRNVVTDAAN
jgi:hypothetical protein